jgi:hypothetical protein
VSTDGYVNRTREDDYPAINISRIRVGGDLGGVVFVVGTVVCLLVGLPELRGFFTGALGAGTGLAVAMAWWHRGHEHWPGGALIGLGLTGH